MIKTFNKKHIFFKVFFMVAFFLFMTGCRNIEQERIFSAENSKKNIKIGVSWPFDEMRSHFKKGILLARDTINSKGGVLGRKIEMIFKDDKSDISKGIKIAESFVNDPDIIAVIGNYNSYISIPASAMYEKAGILMVSPGSTVTSLTHKGKRLFFRNIPNDIYIGKQISHFAKTENFKKILLLYERDDYGKDMANSFEKEAYNLGLELVDRVSYGIGSKREFIKIIRKWENLDYDSIFISGTMPEAALFIKYARKEGIDCPIFGGDGLNYKSLIDIAGKASEGVMANSFYNINDKNPINIAFVKAFRKKYKMSPDAWAAKGYEAINLIADAIKRGKSAVPSKIAHTMRTSGESKTVTGIIKFKDNGDIEDTDLLMNIVKNGKLTHLTTIKKSSK